MQTRVIVQSSLFPEGLVAKLDSGLSAESLEKAIRAAVAAHCGEPDFLLFDEADDEQETREFADDERLTKGKVFHAAKCRSVKVSVRYAGRIVERSFIPAARVGRVRRWALAALQISRADATELVLQVAGTTTQPSNAQHVGIFVSQKACDVVFDLVRTYTVNGDITVTASEAKLRHHLDGALFSLGEVAGKWRLRLLEWPTVLVDVFSQSGAAFTLRLQCADYPNAPTGAFWDVEQNRWLAASSWPPSDKSGGAALRSDWQNGTALYIPCDRQSINGHDQWRELYPAWLWDPKVGLSRYLEVVWVLLNANVPGSQK